MVLFGCIIVIILLIKNGQKCQHWLGADCKYQTANTHCVYLQHAQVNQNTHIHVVCYHARQLLILRNRLERRLDKVLKRSEHDEQLLFTHDDIVQQMTKSQAKQHIFMVLATPVAEVGRDHDYDWAIVEPSSMRSIIQLAGRVWRHRPNKQVLDSNILILNKNIRALQNHHGPVFTKPGFETKNISLQNMT